MPSVNGAEGISDIEGKVARVSGEGIGQRPSFNGAEGISDIEGKVARVSDEGIGQRRSFKLVVRFLLRDCLARRNRFVDDYPRQFVFEETCFLRRTAHRIVQRCDGEMQRTRSI